MRKTNNKGLVILGNGVVAMRDLDLASRVPTKTKDEDTPYNASLTLSKAFTLFTFILHGKNLPIDTARTYPLKRSETKSVGSRFFIQQPLTA